MRVNRWMAVDEKLRSLLRGLHAAPCSAGVCVCRHGMGAAVAWATCQPRGLHVQTSEAVVHHQKHPQNCGSHPIKTAKQQACVSCQPHRHGSTTPQNHKQEVGCHQHQELCLQRVLVLWRHNRVYRSDRRVCGEEAGAACQCGLALSHRSGQGGSCAFFGHTVPQAKHSAQEIDPGHQHH